MVAGHVPLLKSAASITAAKSWSNAGRCAAVMFMVHPTRFAPHAAPFAARRSHKP